MSLIRHFSIKIKFALIVLPLSVLLLYFGFSNLLLEKKHMNSASDINRLIFFSTDLNDLVHECQKERGMTAGFIGSKGEKFSSKLKMQYKNVDKIAEKFIVSLNTFDLESEKKSFQNKVKRVTKKLSLFKSIRKRVQNQEIQLSEAISFYTNFNTSVISIIEELLLLSEIAEISRDITAYVSLLKSKERAGIQRAVMTNIFAQKVFNKEQFKKLSFLVAEQNALNETFYFVTNKTVRELYNKKMANPVIKKVKDFEKIAFSEDAYTVDPEEWFQIMTQKIDLLKDIENFYNKQITNISSDLSMSATISFYFNMVLLFFFLFLAATITHKILNEILVSISQLSSAANKVAEGNNQIQLDINSEDELGDLSNAFNLMVQKLEHSYKELDQKAIQIKERLENEVAQKSKQIEKNHKYLEDRVSEILMQMEKFSKGDLTVQLPEENIEGNILRLYQGFNRTVNNVRHILVDILDLVDTTSAATTEISASVDQLSSGTENQVEQSLSVNAAVEEMSQTISHNATNATRSSGVASNNEKIAKEGNQVVNAAVNKINDIAETVNDSLSNIQKLADSTILITKIVNVIKDISSQTNLLALNAAIEAASAGAMGRGFSVVAEEVRKLAERTTVATGEITRMIGSIQQETDAVINRMKSTHLQVDEGIELATRAGEVLEKIVRSSTDVQSISEEIAVANGQQATASSEISISVNVISDLSKEASNGIGQISSACEDLYKKTERLQQTVQQFTL